MNDTWFGYQNVKFKKIVKMEDSLKVLYLEDSVEVLLLNPS